MLLKSVSFRDYCLYAGEQTFDLTPRSAEVEAMSKKPVVLFGGKNGAGKTTLLDALRLGLYGRQSFGTISENNYKKELQSRIHVSRTSGHRANSSKIVIEFDLASQGHTNSYSIERIWELRNEKIDERLRVLKDGLLLDETETKHWPSFIAEIVPERLSQLFFFDGEKIKNIAEDISSNQAIASSIRTLLGLDIVERLKIDLGIYLTTRVEVSKAKDFQALLKDSQSHLVSVNQEIQNSISTLAENNTDILGIQSEIRKLKVKLNELGQSFAEKLSENEEREEELKNRLKKYESDFRAQTETGLAFALCPRLIDRFITQLSKEECHKKYQGFGKESLLLEKKLQAGINNFDQVAGQTKSAFLTLVRETFSEYKAPEQELEFMHDLPEKTLGKIIHSIEESPKASVKRVKTIHRKYEETFEELRVTKSELEKAPSEELIQPIVEELTNLSKQEGELESKRKQLKIELKQLESRKSEIQREIIKSEKEIERLEKDNEKVQYVEKLRNALDDYECEVTKMKIASLEHAVADCFKSIIRKPKFAESVTVDPETFETNLYDLNGVLIPRSVLSSGEKQIFAISMLWGLAKTSGRPLPVVIDTPLGRLDSEHRKNLIQNYFPQASHQVIMLSTDTEVDEELYRDLEPHLSHCYHLVYDAEAGMTMAENNYFWKA